MNVHHKCQDKVANLCGINQKLLAEALTQVSQVGHPNVCASVCLCVNMCLCVSMRLCAYVCICNVCVFWCGRTCVWVTPESGQAVWHQKAELPPLVCLRTQG